MGLHCKGTAGQNEPVPFAEYRAAAENIAADQADAFEDAQAALDGQADLPAEAAGQGMDQRGARSIRLRVRSISKSISAAQLADQRLFGNVGFADRNERGRSCGR
jgi:hypothetical protein